VQQHLHLSVAALSHVAQCVQSRVCVSLKLYTSLVGIADCNIWLITAVLLTTCKLCTVAQINCVVMGGVNTDELGAFVELTKHQQLDVRFIEWMPFDDNRWNGDKFIG
jgi:cobalamin synthase